MTTIVSRLYADADTAAAAASALEAAGHDPATIACVPAEAGAEAIAAAGVGSVSAARYATRPGTVLVVRAPFTPFGRARSAMAIADAHGPLPVAGVQANQHVPIRPDPRIFHPAITRHAHVMTYDMPPHIGRRRGLVSAAFGVPLLWRRAVTRARAGGPVTGFLGPLVWRRRPSGGVSGARHLSRLFWPMPLISR